MKVTLHVGEIGREKAACHVLKLDTTAGPQRTTPERISAALARLRERMAQRTLWWGNESNAVVLELIGDAPAWATAMMIDEVREETEWPRAAIFAARAGRANTALCIGSGDAGDLAARGETVKYTRTGRTEIDGDDNTEADNAAVNAPQNPPTRE